MRNALSLFAGLLAVALPQSGRAEDILATVQKDDRQHIIIHAGRLIDGTDLRVKGGSSIIIDGDRIIEVIPGFVERPGYDVINMRSATVLPGLIDLHTHLAVSLMDTNRTADRMLYSTLDRAFFSLRGAKATLDAGFTSVRDVGGGGGIDIALKRAIDAGTVEGPRMWVAGTALSPTGGHSDLENGGRADFNHPDWSRGVADGVEEFRKAVRTGHRDGSDLIKISISGGTGSVGDSPFHTLMTEDEVRAVVDSAHALGMKVAAHVQNKQAGDLAIRTGVDTIEHGAGLDATSYKLMREKGTYLIPTMLIAQKLLEAAETRPNTLNKDTIAKVRAIVGGKRERVCEAHRAGVKIGFGTDVRVEFGANSLPSSPSGKNINAQEFALMVAACFTPMEAIRTATGIAAEVIGSDQIGTVQPGRFADLVAVAGDPSTDVTELEHPVFVMKGGRVIVDQKGKR